MIGVHVCGVTKAFPAPDKTRKVAVEALDLAVAPGEFVCVLGPSGCGKTTLLNMIHGLAKPDAGRIFFVGRDRKELDRPARIGYVFQDSRLLPWLTVEQNILFVLDPEGERGAEEARRTALHWLGRVGLAPYAAYYPSQLSIGMQQRVAVARALAIGPELLLMDEPLSSLDEITARGLRNELLDLWGESGATVIFVTHNPHEAVFLADRVVVLRAGPGRVIGEISVSERLARPRDPRDPNIWSLAQEAVSLLEGGAMRLQRAEG